MTKRFRATISAVTLSALLSVSALPAFAAQKKTAAKKPAPKPVAQAKAPTVAPATPYGKGYQSGYTAGYTQGDQDWRNNTPFDFRASRGYQERDRNDSQYASSAMYSQGYDLGFQMGYSDSYYGRSRNAEVPANGEIIARASGIPTRDDRGDTRADNRTDNRDNNTNRDNPPSNRSTDRNNRNSDNRRSDSRSSASLNIPVNTALRIKLTSQISTKAARVGDRFTAVVVSPEDYANATVEGHVSAVNRSGRVSGKTELNLVFDSITMENGRSGALTADLEKVFESENVKTVDEEGTIQSGSRSSDSKKRGGIGAAGGAIIGGIVGGVTGAIVGAVIGGAAGVGTVAIEGNKDLILEPGTEMQIRVSRNTRDR